MLNTDLNSILYQSLVNKKIILNEISEKDEKKILKISEEFLMSGYILNSVNFSKRNIFLHKKMIELNDLLVFRNSLMIRELSNISEKFIKNNIKFVVLKGMALNTMKLYDPGIRFSRDIDILVAKNQIKDAYNIMTGCGYKYINQAAQNRFKYFGDSHQIPPLVNDKKIIVELHHRVSSPKFYNKCPLTDQMFRDMQFIENIPVPSFSCLVAHSLYHGLRHHNLSMGPIFLFDINKILNMNGTVDIDENIIRKTGFLEDYKNILDIFYTLRSGHITKNIVSKINRLMVDFDWTHKDQQKVKLFSKIKSDREKRFNFQMFARKIKLIQYKYQVNLISISFFRAFLVEIYNDLRKTIKF